MTSEPTLREAMEALRPFAEAAELFPDRNDRDGASVRVGDLRRAAKAYEALSRANAAADGKVPARETAWLVERRVDPPQYLTPNVQDLTDDPWRAERFATERDADNARLRLPDWIRDQSRALEHVFINKPDGQEPNAAADVAVPREPTEEQLRERFEEWMASSNYPEIADIALEKLPDGNYKSQLTFAAWQAWKAPLRLALAASPSHPEAKPACSVWNSLSAHGNCRDCGHPKEDHPHG